MDDKAQIMQLTTWVTHAQSLIGEPIPFDQSYPVAYLPYSGNSRLGFYYQHACMSHFASHPNYQIKASEIQVFEYNEALKQNKTLGEIDFLIQNQDTQELEHWEVAVKFYLLDQGLWYGPNRGDRLDLKLAHMLEHQLKMSQTAAFKAQYPEYANTQIVPKLLLQGRLYTNPFLDQDIPQTCLGYPLNQAQICGHWCYHSQMNLLASDLGLVAFWPIHKVEWLYGKETCKPEDGFNIEEIKAKFFSPTPAPCLTQQNGAQKNDTQQAKTNRAKYNKTRPLHCLDENGEFWFIVPNDWA